MLKKIKRTLSVGISVLILILSLTVCAFAAVKEGREYSDEFSTKNSVSMSTHAYGYKNIKMKAKGLWSNGASQEIRVTLYTKDGRNYVSRGSCLCSTSTSGGTYTWYNANTNKTLAKPAYFSVSKKYSNSVPIGGTIVSWSFE